MIKHVLNRFNKSKWPIAFMVFAFFSTFTKGRENREAYYGKYESMVHYFAYNSQIIKYHSLQLKKDSFCYKTETQTATVFKTTGLYQVVNDTIILFDLRKGIFGRFVSVDHEFLILIEIKDTSLKMPDNGVRMYFQNVALYYPNGKTRIEKWAIAVAKGSNLYVKYKLNTYDSLGRITSSLVFKDFRKNGSQDTLVPLRFKDGSKLADKGIPDSEIFYSYRFKKSGRWRNGRKVGKWHYYDKDGLLIRTERYRYKTGLVK